MPVGRRLDPEPGHKPTATRRCQRETPSESEPINEEGKTRRKKEEGRRKKGEIR
jgi:hypothetical protein